MVRTYKEEDDNTVCKICGKYCDYLGSHLWHAHGIKSKPYKQRYGLDGNYPLMSQKTMEKKQAAYKRNEEKYKKNLSSDYHFKKGQKRTKFSEQSKERARKVGREAFRKTSGHCPVCNMWFKNVHTHLREKHGLKYVNMD